MEPESANDILVLSENGYGKRTDLDAYRTTNRGGKGVKTMQVTEKTGKVVSIQSVSDEYDLMIITRNGTAIRTAASDIRLAGRATQGVKVINLRAGDSIAPSWPFPKAKSPKGERRNDNCCGGERRETRRVTAAALEAREKRTFDRYSPNR